MKKTRVLYILMEFPNLDIEQEMEEEMYIAPFIVGVFSKKSLAMDVAEELYVKNKERYLYLIEDYVLNEMYFKDEEEIEREISEHLEEMVKEGVVDYKIGEDGNFYFEVVEDKKDKKMNESFRNDFTYCKPNKWDITFFNEAILWSKNSHDAQTKCGCTLVKDKTSISTGYNGFIRDIDDKVLPRVRPEKYPFMIHAEANAIYNSVRLGRSTLGSTAYITGPPCLACLQMLYQCGISKIKFTDVSNIRMDIFSDNYLKILELIRDKISLSFTPREWILK